MQICGRRPDVEHTGQGGCTEAHRVRRGHALPAQCAAQPWACGLCGQRLYPTQASSTSFHFPAHLRGQSNHDSSGSCGRWQHAVAEAMCSQAERGLGCTDGPQGRGAFSGPSESGCGGGSAQQGPSQGPGHPQWRHPHRCALASIMDGSSE